jgi:hypothetical protein
MKRIVIGIDRVVLRGASIDHASFGEKLQSELARLLSRRSSGESASGTRDIRRLDIHGEANTQAKSPSCLLARGIAGALRE